MKNSSRAALSSIEAAEYLGLSVATLRTWRCRGKGPNYVKLGRSVVYRIVDLDAYLADNLVGGAA